MQPLGLLEACTILGMPIFCLGKYCQTSSKTNMQEMTRSWHEALQVWLHRADVSCLAATSRLLTPSVSLAVHPCLPPPTGCDPKATPCRGWQVSMCPAGALCLEQQAYCCRPCPALFMAPPEQKVVPPPTNIMQRLCKCRCV